MESNHTIYFNMCHHYRKVLNAKPRVDTSLPKAIQAKDSNAQRKQHRQRKSLNQDSQKLPAEMRNVNVRQNSVAVLCPYYYQRHVKDNFEYAKKSFTSTNLKNNVQFKPRATQIYCPTRKKHVQLSAVSDATDSCQARRNQQNIEMITPNVKNVQTKITKRSSVSSVHNYSGESSEDSAYNEGECNLSCDSRGSSPQNSINKHESPEQIHLISSQSLHLNLLPLTTRNKTEDIVCIQFLRDITTDILRKNIFTNKALRNVFEQHVSSNKYNLQKEKMLMEITKLKERLGVPEDDRLDDEDYGLGKINLIDDGNEDKNEKRMVISKCSFPLNVGKIDNDTTCTSRVTNLFSKEVKIEETYAENDYSDNFSEENSYSESSPSHRERSDRSTSRKSSIETHDEAVSDSDEVVNDLRNSDEKYSDVEEENASSHLESDLEISDNN